MRWYWEDEDFGSTDYRIDGGYASFLGALADGSDVILDAAVTNIERSETGVVVRAANTEYSADVAIPFRLGFSSPGVPPSSPRSAARSQRRSSASI